MVVEKFDLQAPDQILSVFNDQRNLYMINPDGSGKTQLADDVYSYHNFALSPDGSKIAYVDNPNSVTKQQDLYVINLNSLEKTRLVTDVGGSFAWSSDSLKIAFVDRWIGQTAATKRKWLLAVGLVIPGLLLDIYWNTLLIMIREVYLLLSMCIT
jgi:hypothetical protein